MKKIIQSTFVFLLLFALASARPALAQVESTAGNIQGEVVDTSGRVVPGAAVEVKNIDTNAIRTGETNGQGHFDFLSLQPGSYIVTITKSGFASTIQQNLILTVGRTTSLRLTLQVAGTTQSIIVSSAPDVDISTTSSTSTLNEQTIATTPVLGRKFEDLLTLTPGVSIVQGPDGDEININGQRGIFNNISLDGGDYNNGFFGEQSGGQRAAVDITLEAVREFQVVASGANAEFGRTAGGVINVITKSGTNSPHGSLFYYQRLQALTANTSNGKPLQDFHREQFGGSFGGPIVKDKLFFFGAGEGIAQHLQRSNLSTSDAKILGSGACSVTNPVFGSNISDGQIAASGDCQRQVLINFYKKNYNEDEGQPVIQKVRNGAFFGRTDYTVNNSNQFFASYNYDYSKNANQTFDVPTYGTTANGTEGPANVQTVNFNLTSTVNPHQLNEAHVAFGYESRPRSAIDGTAVPDTGIGFFPSFRFGQPFFLGPGASEDFYHIDLKDSYSLIAGKHTIKAGFGFLYSHNEQIFDGFALGRYIFGSTTGFLHYATPASTGNGYGPNVQGCSDGSFISIGNCPVGTTSNGSPLFLYLQDAGTKAGQTVQQAGYSKISNKEPAVFIQDTWQTTPRLTFNFGIRWEAQIFPQPAIAPSSTAYGTNLSDPRFPSTGYIPDQKKQFQPRFGFAYDLVGNGKSVLRGSAGIFNARQNGLTQVGAITTNGVQQQTLTQFAGVNPTYPGILPFTPVAPGTFPFQPGVTVFDKNYHNPRVYNYNVGYDQQLIADYVAFVDFTISKGVYLTRFLNPNIGGTVIPAVNADTVSYSGAKPFNNLGDITNTISNSKSLYRGFTVGLRKRQSHHFTFEGTYTYSVDRDDDSNERDPFSFRYANFYNLKSEYSYSDRDQRHKFNAYVLGDLPFGFKSNVRLQYHSASPITDNVIGDGSGTACSINNSRTRFVNGVDCGRNHLRKDNNFFVADFGVARPIRFHDSKFQIVPRVEVFNTFNNRNNINPLSSVALFNFDGFIRQGVGDPRQAQLSLRFVF